MSIASAIIAVVGVGVSAKGQSDARREQKEGRAVQSAAQLNEDIAAQRRSARQERIKRAQILQAAENTGASGSSKEIGAVSSLTQQAAANVSRQSGQQLASEGLSRVSQNISDAQTLQAVGGAMQKVGGSAFKESGGFDNLFN